MVSIKRLMERARPRTLYMYGDESGALKGDHFFFLGLLFARNPHRHEQEIYRLRNQHGFHPELKYSSTNRAKLPFALDLLEYFWHEPDLRFSTLLVNTKYLDLDRFRRSTTKIRAPDIAYNYWYRKLIESCCTEKDDLVVYLDRRSRAREDNLPEYLNKQVREMKSLHLVDSKQHQLVQVADLLTGSVYGHQTEVTNAVKRAIADRLAALAGVERLGKGRQLDHDRKFRIWRFRLERKGRA